MHMINGGKQPSAYVLEFYFSVKIICLISCNRIVKIIFDSLQLLPGMAFLANFGSLVFKIFPESMPPNPPKTFFLVAGR